MDNPYSAPTSNPSGRESLGFSQEGVTQGVVSQLARTKGWVRFLGVLGFIGACLALLGGLGMMGAAGFMGKAMAAQPQSAQVKGFGEGLFYALGIGYLIFGFLMFYPSLKLNQYASAIARLIYTGKAEDLADAIERQRAYWKFTGMMLALMLVMSLAFIGIAIVGVTAFQNL